MDAFGRYPFNSSVIPVDVIMPLFNQGAFVSRAIGCLLEQDYQDWHLCIVNDGSGDNSYHVASEYLSDERVKIISHPRNLGLGSALSTGLSASSNSIICYLPADDIIYRNHISSLLSPLLQNPEIFASVATLNPSSAIHTNAQQNDWLQLVQVMHRRVSTRPLVRNQLTTDNLDWMYWNSLRSFGSFVSIGLVTCEWTAHPLQRHRLIQEQTGGLNTYRSYYQVNTPMRFRSSTGDIIDEIENARFLASCTTTLAPTDRPLNILLAGDLSYNPERILALEERGHQLYGLWLPYPRFYNAVGPLPYGTVKDITLNDLDDSSSLRDIDIVYALLNFQSIPFLASVLPRIQKAQVPIVWHFKESPFHAIRNGILPQLMQLYQLSSGNIFPNQMAYDWLDANFPGLIANTPYMFLDGELPRASWFKSPPHSSLSSFHDSIHTVVIGRAIGLTKDLALLLAQNDIHIHFYGRHALNHNSSLLKECAPEVGLHMHLHSSISFPSWSTEFSKFDAGWLHLSSSQNHGELAKMNWSDLNIPSRLPILVGCNVPSILMRNPGSLVAVNDLVSSNGIGVEFSSAEELVQTLLYRYSLRVAKEHCQISSDLFTFDSHIPDIEQFLWSVVSEHSPRK